MLEPFLLINGFYKLIRFYTVFYLEIYMPTVGPFLISTYVGSLSSYEDTYAYFHSPNHSDKRFPNIVLWL